MATISWFGVQRRTAMTSTHKTKPPTEAPIDSAPDQPVDPTGYLSLIRKNRDFKNLWYGQIVSLLGDWFNLIASASLIGQLTGSGLAIGGLFVVRMLAPFLISPLAGVIADRYNRKRILIITDLSRALVVFCFLLVRRAEDVWLLYTLTALQLAISGIFFPTRNAILPDVVDRSELGAANALSSATWSVMLALGAALGGLVAGGWGIQPAFVIDALTFLVSAAFLSRISYTHTANRVQGDMRPRVVLSQYIDGLRYLKNHPDILFISTHKAAIALVASGAFQVVQVQLAERVFVIGEGGGISLGLLYAAAGIGTGIGPIIARHFTGDRDHPLRLAILLAYILTSVGLLIIFPLTNFGLTLAGTLLRSFGSGINWVFATQLLLQLVPDDVRGRVFSTEFAFFTLGNALSSAAGGWLLDSSAFNLQSLMLLMAIASILPAIPWFFWIRSHSYKEAASKDAASQ
jgi:NRE family putative nickel resistance protein-like MFS transporter